MSILFNNYNASLKNCQNIGLALYQSLTNDPQFIFAKIPAGTYELRCIVKLKELQFLDSSLEIYWRTADTNFSAQAKLAYDHDDDSVIELFVVLEEESCLRVDPVRIKGQFEFEILMNACSPEYAKRKMALALDDDIENVEQKDLDQIFNLYKEFCSQNVQIFRPLAQLEMLQLSVAEPRRVGQALKSWRSIL